MIVPSNQNINLELKQQSKVVKPEVLNPNFVTVASKTFAVNGLTANIALSLQKF